MPGLDVSDILYDPDFMTTFSVVRSAVTVDATGRAVAGSTTVSNVYGVVQPASTSALNRLPEAMRQSGAITIYTTYRLTTGSGPAADGTGASASDDADVVLWGGSQWTVLNTDDWTQFGAGYMRATAVLRSPGD